METLLGVRFLASEYGTGPVHGGRIDSLGLDENGSPVIVEYKRGVDAGVINQGLFYLSWLVDHRAEFEHLVRDRLGATAASQVLWSGPRLICIAGDFTRYDVHAVREHRRSIDLVRYRLFGSDLLGLETVASVSGGTRVARQARPQAVARAAVGVQAASMVELASAVDEALLGLGDGVNRVERKQYRAYQRLRNFACVCPPQRSKLLVYLKVDPKDVDLVPASPGTCPVSVTTGRVIWRCSSVRRGTWSGRRSFSGRATRRRDRLSASWSCALRGWSVVVGRCLSTNGQGVAVDHQ